MKNVTKISLSAADTPLCKGKMCSSGANDYSRALIIAPTITVISFASVRSMILLHYGMTAMIPTLTGVWAHCSSINSNVRQK